MAIYWHPYLTQLIRLSYDDRLRIEEEVPLGEMPLRLDILLYPRVLVQELPFPSPLSCPVWLAGICFFSSFLEQ